MNHSIAISFALLNLFFLGCFGSNAFAQSDSRASIVDAPDAKFAQEFSEAHEEEWAFGVKINCSSGIAEGISVNAPLPIAWPEQEVELYEETKSNNVRRVIVKKLKPGSSYMAFGVRRLNNGDYAEAILRYRVKRKSTLPPEDTEQFRFAEKLPRKIKRDSLGPSPFIESNDEKIREISETLLADTKDLSDWEQVESIYNWVRENVKYKFDKQQHSCLHALEVGHGDCEELSSLFIAICRSRKIPARAVWVPGHTYPEFYLEDQSGKGHWFPCQIAGARHEFGEMSETRPILQKGDRFKSPVSREVKRYNEAALAAEHSTGSLAVEHIMRRVEDE